MLDTTRPARAGTPTYAAPPSNRPKFTVTDTLAPTEIENDLAPERFATIRVKAVKLRRSPVLSCAETMDTYGHLFPDAEDLGRGVIDATFAAAATEQGRNQQIR
jgi:hypothetical protein